MSDVAKLSTAELLAAYKNGVYDFTHLQIATELYRRLDTTALEAQVIAAVGSVDLHDTYCGELMMYPDDVERAITATFAAHRDGGSGVTDQDSAAVERSIGDVIQDCMDKGYYPWQIARAVLSHMREHPEDLGIPVIESSRFKSVHVGLNPPYIVIPDPPAAEPVPNWDDLIDAACIEYHRSPGIHGNRDALMAAIKAAQGRADDGA